MRVPAILSPVCWRACVSFATLTQRGVLKAGVSAPQEAEGERAGQDRLDPDAGPLQHLTQDERPAADRRLWYGSQIIAADVAVLLLGVGTGQIWLLPLLAATGPLVHAARGHSSTAWRSVAARLLAPAAGMLLGGGIAIAAGKAHESPVAAALGLLAGALVAATIDATVLAYEVPEPLVGKRVSVVPFVAPGVAASSGPAVGLAGTFEF